MFLKLLGEASDDLGRVTPQSRESLHIETTRNKRRCSRPETLVEKSCSRPETPSGKSVWQTPTDGAPVLVPIPQSPPDGSGICAVKLEPVSKAQPSRESLAQVVDGDLRKQLEISVPLHEAGEWNYESKMSSFTTTILKLLFAEAQRKGKTRNFRMCVGRGSDGLSADKLSLDLKFNPWTLRSLFDLNGAR